jgi:hypothetical protein
LSLDGLIANLMETTTALVVRVVELARDATVSSEPAPVGRRIKDLTGTRRDFDEAEPQAAAGRAAQPDGSGEPHQLARPDTYDADVALNERLAAFDEQQRSKPSLNPVAYGAKMAELEAKQRRRTAIVDEDYFGRES